MVTYWVVVGYAHLYGEIEQWIVGVFSSQSLADHAIERDTERYYKFNFKPSFPTLRYETKAVRLDDMNHGYEP